MKGNKNLRYLIGKDGGLPQDGPVLQLADLWATAIRRRMVDRDAIPKWSYFLQLEVQIP